MKKDDDIRTNVEIFSKHYLERFKQLLDDNRTEDAVSIMQEYVVDGIEDDNYQWLFVNNLLTQED